MAEPPEPSLATVTSRCTLLKSTTKSTRMSKGSEALVQALLGKKFPKGFRHIKGFKVDGAVFQCPIMGLEFNGKYKFFALQNCGHVVSAKALKEVKSLACLVCHKEFVESDKVAEVAALREMMKEEKAKTVKGKKKRGMDVLDGEKGFKGLSNGEMKKFRAADAAQAHATKETPLNLGFGPQTWRKRGMGVGDREKGFKGLNNGGMKKFRAADMVPANATKEVYSSIFYYLEEVGFKGTLTCRSLRWVETDGMVGEIIKARDRQVLVIPRKSHERTLVYVEWNNMSSLKHSASRGTDIYKGSTRILKKNSH
ncbi:protein RTF2-like protein [Gossypium australe]|uniref:Protein RTF2-like protein n=1 Tax=Gossypium australe TaxID=47621 RepID=A0A5B6UT12_9ROSI|nr:protein RTF2-like protein [Gossypium australe]